MRPEGPHDPGAGVGAEQQLRAANQQLEASNQQLRATEQQLRATEQQLRAHNQQLEATIRQLDASEAQVRHLNAILRGIREVNRLITRERDPDRLIQRASELLVSSRGITKCTFVLWDGAHVTAAAAAGDASKLAGLRRMLGRGELPECLRGAIEAGEVIVRGTPADTCVTCPVALDYAEQRDAVAVRLRSRGQTLGALLVSFPCETMSDPLEIELLREVADDVALALGSTATEVELRASEERFRAAFDSASIGRVLTRPDGRLARVNRALCELLGYTRAELEQRTFAAITHPGDVEASRECVRALLAGEQHSCRLEKRYLHRDGHSVWTEVSTTLLRDEDGQPRNFITDIMDMTRTRRLALEREHAQRRSEALLRATRVVLEQQELEVVARRLLEIGAGYLGTCAGRLVLFGEEQQDALCHEWGEGGPPPPGALPAPVRALRERACRALRAAFENGLRAGEPAAPVPGGEAALDSVMFAPLVLGERAVGLLCYADRPGGFTGDDVRFGEALAEIAAIALREHRTHAALRASEEQHRVLFDGSADALMTLAPPSWRFTSGNAAAVELFGARDEADFISRAPWDYAPPTQPDGRPSADRAREMVALAMERGSHYFDWQHRSLAGREFPATVLLTRIELGGEALLQATVRDITEHRHMQSQIAQADRLSSMGMLAAGVAHEINNPLAYVLYNLQSLTEELPGLMQAFRELQLRAGGPGDGCAASPDSEAGQGYNPVVLQDMLDQFDDALGGTHRIRDIVRGLGTFSRVEEHQVVPVDLNRVCDVAVNMAFNEIKYRARLTRDYGQVPAVLASEGRLSQVLLNLIINATRAIEEGDVEGNEIRVRTWSEHDAVLVEVRDTGSGIEPHNLERLFEPFFTTKQVGAGSGLGLSISKNIVEGYGGAISVDSEPGQGTRFVVRLPVQAAQEETAAADAVAAEESQVRGRILLVDDEAGIRAAMARMLRGHETVQAASGAEARQLLEQDQAFDLILCDMMMPDVSGMDLHRWLREVNPGLARALIFVTGGAFTPRARDYLNEVDNLRLEKPFDVAGFKKIVNDRLAAARRTGSS